MRFLERERNKKILDTLNSLAWFSMDAAWMLQMKDTAVTLAFPTLISGFFLCFLERKKSLTIINIAVLSWICMNVSWMFSELYTKKDFLLMAKVLMAVGIICMAVATYFSKNRSETLLQFTRLRLKNLF